MTKSALVGEGMIRADAPEKVLGKTRFVGDLVLPNMLWGKLLHSPFAHARILNINTSQAAGLPGVAAVLTARDVSTVYYGDIVKDQAVFAIDKVRYCGDIVAAVAAEEEELANRALQLIRVDYQELPACLCPEDSLKEDAPAIHEDKDGYFCLPMFAEHFRAIGGRKNLSWQVSIEKGDVEVAFKQCSLILEETYATPMYQAAPLETHGVLANPDGGRVTIWTSSQVPFYIWPEIARILQLPMPKVRIISPAIGGAFGSKGQVRFEPHCALLSLKTGRPVRMVYSTEEEFSAGHPRHASTIRIKSGVSADGILLAREAAIIMDTGAYAIQGPINASYASLMACGPYRIPHGKIDVYTVYTNHPPCSSVRAPGGPQTVFALECHTDHLARKAGLDPVEFRLRNLLEEEDQGPTGQPLTNVNVKEALRKISAAIGWGQRTPGEGRGIGIACYWWNTLVGCPSSAWVRLNEDGSVLLLTGTVEHGSGGTFGLLPQLVAQELGIEVKDVTVVHGDTHCTPYDFGGVGSRTAFNAAQAVLQATCRVKEQILALAADLLEAPQADLVLEGKRVFVKGAPARSISLGEIATAATFSRGPIMGEGSFNQPYAPVGPGVKVRGSTSPTLGEPSFGAQAVEVEVDRETGTVLPVRLLAAQDVGFAINPLGVEGQMEGALIQGLGMAISEEVKFTAGRMDNPNFRDYKMPTSLDVPGVEKYILEGRAAHGISGAKGAGEGAIVPTAAALANALYDALGLEVFTLPMDPERVLTALKRKKL